MVALSAEFEDFRVRLRVKVLAAMKEVDEGVPIEQAAAKIGMMPFELTQFYEQIQK